MTSYTSCFVFSFLVIMMMMMPINSDDLQSRSESELYSNAFSKNDDFTVDKRPSFFVGSRYGRSPQVIYGTKARRLNVAPRNDRFFLGSRYGKRSNEYTIPSDLYNDNEDSTIPTESIILNKSQDNNYYKISCIYTGFKNYFKCNTENNIRH